MDIGEGFHVNERIDVVPMSEAFGQPGFVLMDSLFNVICDADVECARLVAHNVDVIGLAA